MPWALDAARACLDAYGTLRLFPRPGGWHEQDEFEIDALRMAFRVQKLHPRDAKKRKFEGEDPNFLLWLDEEECPVEYVSQIWMENTAV